MKEFSEDEKAVARSIDKEYKWMARNANGCLGVYKNKPKKMSRAFDAQHLSEYFPLYAFGHMFKSIKWEDEEATRIRDIYDPKILNDVEREYIKAVIKPFHEKIEFVGKYGDEFSDDGTYHKEFLFITYDDRDRDKGDLTFPDFDAGKMYSGMELGKRYKLDELGIIYTDTEEAQNG